MEQLKGTTVTVDQLAMHFREIVPDLYDRAIFDVSLSGLIAQTPHAIVGERVPESEFVAQFEVPNHTHPATVQLQYQRGVYFPDLQPVHRRKDAVQLTTVYEHKNQPVLTVSALWYGEQDGTHLDRLSVSFPGSGTAIHIDSTVIRQTTDHTQPLHVTAEVLHDKRVLMRHADFSHGLLGTIALPISIKNPGEIHPLTILG